MPDRARISAIVVTRNRREDLKRCLQGLSAQRPVVEILVVDNASDDGTDALLTDDYPEVTVLRAPENQGTSVTRNAAVRVASGDYFWFLDDDTEILDSGLGAKLAHCLEADTQLAAVGGEAVVDPQGRVVGVKRLNMLVNGMVRGESLTELGEGNLAAANCLATCCFCVRREAFEAVGGFDPLFRFYREDADLCARLQATGRQLAVYGKLPVIHHFSAAGRGLRLFTPQLHRNVYLARHRRWRDLVLLPFHDLIYLSSPASLAKALHFSRHARKDNTAMVTESGSAGLRWLGLLRAALRGGTLALAMLVGYLLCIPRLPAAVRRRHITVGGLAETRLDAYSIRTSPQMDRS